MEREKDCPSPELNVVKKKVESYYDLKEKQESTGS
jgi:hypothetical protein